ncbi:SDR family oxidoreductase [Pseudomonas sp. MAP12]|uniref:SDR family oxidoreductase n=1 Tax=Geopseudomonas aromaticivorans TaxID=2849492 RepID=A0ABS6N241_9GAMM|nr:SDR family oxidoreductase [Pseudomonas aromaticivorans]MBV2135110.1 SDR family oxidoreductase [Pseudomonas aromaticivorans]
MQMLKDDVVLVTGGGSGLGLGVARYCKAEGAEVVIFEISADKVRQLKEEFGPDALIIQGDVTKLADQLACRDAILARYGRLNALIGTQGIFDGNVPLQQIPLERMDALFDELFHVNVKGYMLSARVFFDLLEASQGAMVLTTSTAAYAADGGGLVYTATKGAVRSLVNQLAFEFAPHVRVNGVAPAGIANSQLKGPGALGLDAQKQSDIPKDAFLSMFRSLSLLQELPSAEDHGPLYAFLASRHNKIMTGQTVVADQGMLNRAVLKGGH